MKDSMGLPIGPKLKVKLSMARRGRKRKAAALMDEMLSSEIQKTEEAHSEITQISKTLTDADGEYYQGKHNVRY